MNINHLPPGHQDGKKILERMLWDFYGFETFEQYEEYSRKPIFADFSHIGNERLKVFAVTEKKLSSSVLARVLGGSYSVKHYYKGYGLVAGDRVKEDGPNKETPFMLLYKIRCYIFGKPADILISSTNGHVFKHDFPVPLKDAADAFRFQVVDKPEEGEAQQKSQFYEIAAEAAYGCDAVLLLLDNDLDGESIAFEAAKVLLPSIPTPITGIKMDVVYRAKFMALSEAGMSLQNLQKPNFKKHLAMIGKYYLDFIIGKSFTRQQKVFLRTAFPELYIKNLLFGPCQSVILEMVAKKMEESSSPKFKIETKFNYKDQLFTALSSTTFDDANSATNYCKTVSVKELKFTAAKDQKAITVPAPSGLTTFSILKMFSEKFKLSSFEIAQSLQKLYEYGFISYPRTTSTNYPKHICSKVFVDKLIKTFNENVSSLDQSLAISMDLSLNFSQAKHDENSSTDKSAIYPTSFKSNKQLGDIEFKVFSFVVRWFIATFMEGYEYFEKEYCVDAGNEFKSKMKAFNVTKEGFVQVLPEYSVIDKSSITGVQINVKELYSNFIHEHELLQKLEMYKVGTETSIPKYIKSLEEADYIAINENREIKATPLGQQLIQLYKACELQIILPQYRSAFIEKIEKVSTGEAKFTEVYDTELAKIWNALKTFNENSKNADLSGFSDCFELQNYNRHF